MRGPICPKSIVRIHGRHPDFEIYPTQHELEQDDINDQLLAIEYWIFISDPLSKSLTIYSRYERGWLICGDTRWPIAELKRKNQL